MPTGVRGTAPTQRTTPPRRHLFRLLCPSSGREDSEYGGRLEGKMTGGLGVEDHTVSGSGTKFSALSIEATLRMKSAKMGSLVTSWGTLRSRSSHKG